MFCARLVNPQPHPRAGQITCFPSPSRQQTASAVCPQLSLAGTIVFCIPFGLTEFVGDHLMPTHPGIQPASSNTIGFNVALNLRRRRFSQLCRYRRVNRRSGNFFRFRGCILTRFRGGGRRGRFFRSHERRGEWGGKVMNSSLSVESQSGAMPMEVKKLGSLPKSSVAGVAEPGRGAERLAESFLSGGRIRLSGFTTIVLRDVVGWSIRFSPSDRSFSKSRRRVG